MYWSETEFGAWAVIKVTTSNNSINYNGIKIVKSGLWPLYDFKYFQKITALAGKLIYVQNPQKVASLVTLRFPRHCICPVPENYEVAQQKVCSQKRHGENVVPFFKSLFLCNITDVLDCRNCIKKCRPCQICCALLPQQSKNLESYS